MAVGRGRLAFPLNADIFGLVGSLFLRPLPVAEADRLALVVERVSGWNTLQNVSFPDFKDYRRTDHQFLQHDADSRLADCADD